MALINLILVLQTLVKQITYEIRPYYLIFWGLFILFTSSHVKKCIVT